MEAGVICILLAHLGASDLVRLKRYFIQPCMICDLHFVRPGAYLGQLRVILPTLTFFLIVCIQFALCMDCQFMK